MVALFPQIDPKARVERRADRITDPVERLRFLRREMARGGNRALFTDRGPAGHRALGGRAGRLAPSIVWTAAGLVLLIPSTFPKGATETAAREHTLLIPGLSAASAPSVAPDSSVVAQAILPVWRVDGSEASELYSNGLRIDLTYAVSNRPRERYPIFPLTGAKTALRYGAGPAGIVYHTTESLIAPFEEDENHRLTQLGRNLLEVVRNERAYHYVIDRFGRVFQLVRDTDAANHAGKSVWADTQGIYVNLNASFLGVAFEGQTGAAGTTLTAGQISAAKTLTEMLRFRYRIPAENCVTHAQVSVNPLNMKIGAHTDFAGNFPFRALGLPDNYEIAVPSLYAFGFRYDDTFVETTGGRWKGLHLAEQQIERQAEAGGMSSTQYRAILQRRYKDILRAIDQGGPDQPGPPSPQQQSQGGS